MQFKRLEKIESEELQEDIAERVKLRRQKAGTVIKVLTSNELLTRLPVLLTQIKAGKNSCKLKNEIRQILDLLRQYNKVTETVYNNLL